MRGGFRGEIIRLERRDPEERGIRDLQRGGQQGARRNRLGPVRRVAKNDFRRGAGCCQSEWRGEVSAADTDLNGRNDSENGAEAVGRTGRGRGEVAQLVVEIATVGNVIALFGKWNEPADQLSRRVRRIQP